MNINVLDVLLLDDNNEYVVVSKVNYENKVYYYLVDKNSKKDVKFCYEDNCELVEINDKKLTTKLLPLFAKEAKQVLDKLGNLEI